MYTQYSQYAHPACPAMLPYFRQGEKEIPTTSLRQAIQHAQDHNWTPFYLPDIFVNISIQFGKF